MYVPILLTTVIPRNQNHNLYRSRAFLLAKEEEEEEEQGGQAQLHLRHHRRRPLQQPRAVP